MPNLDEVWAAEESYRAEHGLPPLPSIPRDSKDVERIKALEAENEQLKKDLGWYKERMAQGFAGYINPYGISVSDYQIYGRDLSLAWLAEHLLNNT